MDSLECPVCAVGIMRKFLHTHYRAHFEEVERSKPVKPVFLKIKPVFEPVKPVFEYLGIKGAQASSTSFNNEPSECTELQKARSKQNVQDRI